VRPERVAAIAVVLAAASAHARADVVWYRDVQPIVQARCQACHTTGGVAPFALLSYDDALAHSTQMATMVESRLMPPWKPVAGCRSYDGDRSLSQAEIDTIVAWSRTGALPGDPAEARSVPVPRRELAWVDLTLDTGADYLPAPSHTTTHSEDDYRCFALDPKLAEDRDLIGIDIEPTLARQVHHVLLFSASPADAAAADAAQAGVGWSCFGGPGTRNATTVGGWAPGGRAVEFPPGTGITLERGQALVMQVHYNLTNGPAALDRTKVRLQFAKERVPRPARLLPLADLFFTIPPQARDYATSVSVTIPFASTLFGVAPHMHGLGKRIRAESDDSCLVDIPQWDFRWQQIYFFGEPMSLPAGTRLKLSCSWDNTTTRSVSWGENTSDEMCLAYFYLVY
jgi:mono/diheme cytochrome c family protein